MQHAGSWFLTRDQTHAPCTGSTESQPQATEVPTLRALGGLGFITTSSPAHCHTPRSGPHGSSPNIRSLPMSPVSPQPNLSLLYPRLIKASAALKISCHLRSSREPRESWVEAWEAGQQIILVTTGWGKPDPQGNPGFCPAASSTDRGSGFPLVRLSPSLWSPGQAASFPGLIPIS